MIDVFGGIRQGGYGARAASAAMYQLDTETHTWRSLAPLPKAPKAPRNHALVFVPELCGLLALGRCPPPFLPPALSDP